MRKLELAAPPVTKLAANVVDIRRFSTHDGAGIRTTVFLKGCTLACAWCQNPETIEPRLGPVFFRKKCIDCGRCVEAATKAEASVGEDGHVQVDVTVKDADWASQVERCPTGAIAFNGRRYTVSELVEVVQRDRVFFGSTGGVTLSGGEPLFVPGFAAAVFRELQAIGIDTAIETALNVKPKVLLEALPHLDQVFADCKVFDPELHRHYIGYRNAQILSNIELLLTSRYRAKVTIRTPMIPGISDDDENVHHIARFISNVYPDVAYEILNYNPLAAAKYDVLPGRSYVFDEDHQPAMLTRARMAELRAIARNAGVRNVVIE